ncbi:bacterio-opsin activator domain-containing protein [Halocalculus aciditolerans]|uniref:Bacterioopsin transcriptional activator GAF and HTH associated domain-containing protein n=1 Tax=Halocalculus aciditolerans TaxID=1383812 RepID=A0A830FQB2_9EURY|nr:bacterio-opsin activator domain-containing protein [Halocalculus aciditolerans]GGL69997.1 hypothetical protein GCM10009039_30030 [Halocalculus aciditolerans]
MSLVATFTVPGAQFLLTRALPADDVRVELDRVESLGCDALALHFWVHGDVAPDTFAERLAADAVVRDVVALDTLDGQVLFRAECIHDDSSLLDLLLDTDADVLTAAGTTDATRFVVRFPSEPAVDAFLTATERHRLPVDGIQTFSAADDFDDTRGFDIVGYLFDLGYFDPFDPPSLDDVATSLAVTPDDVRDAYDRVKP